MIRLAELKDAEAICAIYNYYIVNTVISFEETPISVESMKERMAGIISEFPYYVYEEDGKILGYGYATTWKSRSAYKYSVETSIYVNKDSKGLGIGTNLYECLLKELKVRGIHRAIAGISLPNMASVSLHEKIGFKKIAEFTEVGYKFDEWINVGYWEYKL